jgi:hypothetical protein
MPINCPACKADIQSTVDETLADRLARKDREVKAAKDELAMTERALTAEREKLKGFETDRTELETYRKEKSKRERLDVLAAHKIPEAALDDMQTLFDARMASRDEKDRVSFADFYGENGEGRKSVLLASYFGAAPADGGANPSRPGAPAGAPPPPGIGNGNTGAAPPGNGRGRTATPADLQKYFASPEYKALPPAEKKKKLAELQASSSGPGLNGPGSPV